MTFDDTKSAAGEEFGLGSGQPSRPPTVSLEGRRVRLRGVGRQDYDYLFKLQTDPAMAYRWRGAPGTISPEGFIQELWRDVACQFVVEHIATQAPLGLVVAYHLDRLNRTAYMAMALDPTRQGFGWPLESASLFISYVFDVFDVRKLYAEAADFNVTPYERALVYGPLKEEGRLSEHVWIGGAYRDMRLLSIHRRDWPPRPRRGRRTS